MLPQFNRLTGSRVNTIIKSGHGQRSQDLVLYFKKSAEPKSCFAVLVPLRINKRSVVRNRNKRMVTESLRHLLPVIKPGFGCVLITQKDLSFLKQNLMEKKVKELLSRAGLIKSP